MYYDDQTIEQNGRVYRVNLEHDSDMGAPWDEHDGHGPVSDWATRDKHPGELVLHSDRSSKRFYDFAGAMKIARADGWGVSAENIAAMTAKLGRAPARGEICHAAVMSDFEYLQSWCNDEWNWCGVIVTDITDDESADVDYSHAVWGVQSDDDETITMYVQEFIGEFEREQAEAEKVARINSRFSDAMACGV